MCLCVHAHARFLLHCRGSYLILERSQPHIPEEVSLSASIIWLRSAPMGVLISIMDFQNGFSLMKIIVFKKVDSYKHFMVSLSYMSFANELSKTSCSVSWKSPEL